MAFSLGQGHLRGHCGVTSNSGDCDRGELGSWVTTTIGVTTVEGCARHCLLHCKRCNYVSFDRSHADCSWYSHCPRLQWRHGGLSYKTVQVRASVGQESAAPAVPAPAVTSLEGQRLASVFDEMGTTQLQKLLQKGAATLAHRQGLSSAAYAPTARQLERPASYPNVSHGYCALMGPDHGNCELSEQGSWAGVSNAHECKARCRRCQNCNYISFTQDPEHPPRPPRHHAPFWWSCRWFSECDLSDLRQRPRTAAPYFSRRVQCVRCVVNLPLLLFADPLISWR